MISSLFGWLSLLSEPLSAEESCVPGVPAAMNQRVQTCTIHTFSGLPTLFVQTSYINGILP
jgi:hypothetical protein